MLENPDSKVNPVFEAVACFLNSDTEAREFFTGNRADLETITGPHLILVVPDSTQKLFTAEGRRRYPGMRRADLPCLWVEDNTRQSFWVPLGGLKQPELRERLSRLADAAVVAHTARELQTAFGTHYPTGGGLNLNNPNHLLVRLGQIAGVAGIALGILAAVFHDLLHQTFWPQLDPNQAYYLLLAVLLTAFAIALAGILVWASQVHASRSTIRLAFAFGCVTLAVLAFISRPASSGSGYRVRVTVLDPNRVPVNQAHVWSTLGGEVKQVDGGFEIDIPALPSGSRRPLTIRAEVNDRAWRGETSLELGSDHAPPATIQLASAGEANLRGTVVDENGDSVANVFVGVVGFETVTTDAHGNFSVPAHATAGSDVQLHAEKTGYVSTTSTIPAGANPSVIVLKHKGSRPSGGAAQKAQPRPALAKTGDAVIDRVQANLAELKQLDRAPAESRIAAILAQLFDRPAFYGIREGDWRYFLYPLCRTRMLLEEQVSDFKSNPDARAKIDQAIRLMVQLQNTVARLYGPTFSIADHLNRHAGSVKDFDANLPPVIENPTVVFFDERDAQIRQIRQLLREAGLPLQ